MAKKGDRLLIALEQDSKDRLWGIIADEPVFRSISRTPGEELKIRTSPEPSSV